MEAKTYVSMLWTVILGELVVNRLEARGVAESGNARSGWKAGRSSLKDMRGRSGGVGDGDLGALWEVDKLVKDVPNGSGT